MPIEIYHNFAADIGNVTTTPVDSGTLLGAIAVIISLLISGAGLLRSWKLDSKAAKKADIDTVIENYRLMLTDSKDRETKLEKLLEESRQREAKLEAQLDESRITIRRLEDENAELKTELERYRAAKKTS